MTARLIAVFHHPDARDAVEHYLDKLSNEGIKTVGIETPNNYHQESLKDLKKIAEATPGETGKKLLLIHHALVSQEPGKSFFEHVAEYARGIGLTIIPMQGKTITLISHRALFYALRAIVEKTPVPENLTAEAAFTLYDKAMRQSKETYPLGYTQHALRDRKMRGIAQRAKPDAIIAGGGHIVPLALAMKIPLREVVWIEPNIISHRATNPAERNYIRKRIRRIITTLKRQRSVNAARLAHRRQRRKNH